MLEGSFMGLGAVGGPCFASDGTVVDGEESERRDLDVAGCGRLAGRAPGPVSERSGLVEDSEVILFLSCWPPKGDDLSDPRCSALAFSRPSRKPSGGGIIPKLVLEGFLT